MSKRIKEQSKSSNNNESDVQSAPFVKRERLSFVRNIQLADMVTLCNGVCGSLSILTSMRSVETNDMELIFTSIMYMFAGLIFDFLDGRVARWRNKSSLLGQELDSLADLISFGVAPAALAYAVGMRTHIDTYVLTYFICCGIARLARYNATVALQPKDESGKIAYFEGTPIPTSLAIVFFLGAAAKYYPNQLPGELTHIYDTEYLFHPLVFVYAVSGTLMVSKTLRIPKP